MRPAKNGLQPTLRSTELCQFQPLSRLARLMRGLLSRPRKELNTHGHTSCSRAHHHGYSPLASTRTLACPCGAKAPGHLALCQSSPEPNAVHRYAPIRTQRPRRTRPCSSGNGPADRGLHKALGSHHSRHADKGSGRGEHRGAGLLAATT